MDIYEVWKLDKKKIFKQNLKLVEFTLTKTGQKVPVYVMPAFIGILETTDGINFGVDNTQCTFDSDDLYEKNIIITEGDTLILTSQTGGDIKCIIEKIARDRTLGLFQCQLKIVKTKSQAGIIDRDVGGMI